MERSRHIWGPDLSLILINLAAILERADETLLPAVYREVGQTFNASPSELGYLTFVRALVQALCSPLAGVLATRYHRPSVLGLGTLFWAFSTAAMGLSQTFMQCAFWRAVNGVGLAIVIPALQSFVADSHLEGSRGVAFGWLNLVGSLGGIGGSIMATILAGYTFGGMAGWRVAFLILALISSAIGLLVYTSVNDPRDLTGRPSTPVALIQYSGKTDDEDKMVTTLPNIWRDSLIAIKEVLKVRTFQLIVMQGLVGSFPWSAMVFFTMWLELIGFGHKGAASLMGIFASGCAMGALLGGWIADKLSKRYPTSGRIMCAQFSSFMGVPFSCLLLLVLPQEASHWNLFAATLLFMGLTISWCQACANNPMFADVVPVHQRTMIYAFDRAFEGSFSALAAPTVGLLAEKVYGYRVNAIISESGSAEEALAISRGLFSMMALPFGLCCLCYTPLYITYKTDREAANRRR